jgi:TonB-dependent receptor
MLFIRNNLARDGRMLVIAAAVLSFCVTGSVVRAADPSNPGAEATPTPSPGTNVQGTSQSQTSQSQLPTVVVTGTVDPLSQDTAFDEQHNAPNEIDILSWQNIQQTPAKTIGQAVQQLPGVSVQHDTGEPRFAQIRGTDANLNIIKYNGVVLPSYFPGFRAVPLDSVPAALVANIDVIKTLLPYMDGEGVGGQFNLEPKSAFDYKGMYVEVNAEGGYGPLRNRPTAYGSFTFADTFCIGPEAKLGILVAGLVDWKQFGIDDLEEAYSSPGVAITDKSISNYNLRFYTYERRRAGIGTNIDLRLNPDNRFFLDFVYGGYNEYRQPRFETVYSGLDVTSPANILPNGSFITTPGNVSVKKDMENTLQENRFFTVIVGGEHKICDIAMDWKASYSQASQDQPYYNIYNFSSLPGSITGSLIYNNLGHQGDSPTINLNNLFGQNNPHNYTFTSSVNQSFSSSDGIFAVQGNIKIPLAIMNNPGLLQFGASARVRHRSFDQTYSGRTANDPSGTSNSLFLDQVLSNNFATIYSHRYRLGPQISTSIESILRHNPQYSTAVNETVPNAIGTWSADENVYAGYGMYTVTFDKLTIIGGVRVEGTNLSYSFNQGIFDATNALIGTFPANGGKDYVNVLPNLQLKYDITPNLVARLGYSKSIARPTFQQIVPAIENGDLQATIPGTEGTASQTFGNGNLPTTRSHNFDASIEYYPAEGAILSISGFDKEISDYIKQDYFLNSAGGANVSFSSINHARIYGFELQYEQQFRFLPCPLDGLGVRGSFSRIFSQGQTHPGREETSLPSQAGVIWNAGIFYQKYNWTIWVGATFTGHNLLAVGAPPRTLNGTTVPPSADTYFDGYLQVDAKVQYAINKNLTVYFEGNNLNDGPLRFYAGDPSHPLQNEYYGPSFAGGVKLTF